MSNTKFDLSGQTVVITGGSRSIGRAIVEEYVRGGAKVAFFGLEKSETDEAGQEMRAALGVGEDRLFGMAADLRDRPSLRAFLDQTIERFGPIDSLVGNASDLGWVEAIEDVDFDHFAAVWMANVVGNFYLCQQVLPEMAQRGAGSVILLSSIVGFTTMPANIPYSTSKAAIASMTRSLAAQYANNNVRINCVAPGLIKTEASRMIWEDDEVARAYIGPRVPMNRIGFPEEIAKACAFLSSDAASYITAAILPVDGGRMGVGQQAGVAPKPKSAG
jgi:NAD(P)-dependent dehydrogenase (short-subunit alcohol dehydrogenase family)